MNTATIDKEAQARGKTRLEQLNRNIHNLHLEGKYLAVKTLSIAFFCPRCEALWNAEDLDDDGLCEDCRCHPVFIRG